MTRIAIVFCFFLTLLCPVFCLAGEDGGCSEHSQETGQNCEAMTVGAVVIESDTVAILSWSLLLLGTIFSIWPRFVVARTLTAFRHRSVSKPPPAAVRQSLLQVFLF